MTANDRPPGEADNDDQGSSNSAGSENSSPKSSGSESDRDKASLVVLANRLPFDLEQQPDGSTKARQAPGGLVTALQPILSRRHGAWVGWPGTADTTLEPTTTGGLTLEPIALSTDEVNDYYEGFSNATLWPLYHDAVAASEFHRPWWDSYHAVNARFAERAAEVAAPNATVWIHDYQLQLVPEMLRQLRPDVRIGFFLHIPFPPAELFNRLPWRRQILTGLLGADLIGFQLPGGTRNFVRLARSLLDVPTNGGLLSYDGRTIRVAAFPISIDSAAQSALAATPEVREAAKKLRVDLGSPSKIILGVDRLDYTKGIDVRLTAFRELLAEKDPSVEDAVMVQIATPSRERLQSYIKMREGIERQVGSLNGDFGKIGRPAVHYLHQSFPREELATFYVAADVMTVTPLRDGMNLVAKEYVACRVDGGGTLLLSEFTGAARELRAALQVNPYDTDGVKDGLRAALTMSTVAARRQMRSLRRQVLTHDVDRWAAAFLSALEGTRDRVADARKRLPSEVLEALDEVSTTERLLIATDFDGTLAPIVDDPATARAMPGSVEALRSLASISDTVVAVVSGRSLADLRMFLGENENLQLVGSHGAEVASPTADGSQYPEHTGHSELAETAAARLAELRLALAELTDRYGRVNLEPKPTGIAVHLRGANEDEARAVTTVIEKDLATLPGVQLLRGKMVLELTVVATDKGQAVQQIARDNRCTAIVFIGDDVTDEDAFQSLGSHDVGVKVGDGPTAATVRIVDPAMVRDLLQTLDSARRRSRGRDAAAQSAR